MKSAALLNLVWYLVVVQCQEYPLISFSGVNLANHSYVDITRVGSSTVEDGESVICHTDFISCCSNTEGKHRADWYFPSGIRLQFSDDNPPIIFERCRAQVVALKSLGDTGTMSGIYRCDSPTNRVHDDNYKSVRASAYVGLYTNGGS